MEDSFGKLFKRKRKGKKKEKEEGPCRLTIGTVSHAHFKAPRGSLRGPARRQVLLGEEDLGDPFSSYREGSSGTGREERKVLISRGFGGFG